MLLSYVCYLCTSKIMKDIAHQKRLEFLATVYITKIPGVKVYAQNIMEGHIHNIFLTGNCDIIQLHCVSKKRH